MMMDGKSRVATQPAFTITSAATSARLDANRKAQVSFTVTNTISQPLKGRVRVVPDDPTRAAWFGIDGEPERPFAANGTQQYTVKVAVPPAAPAGKYTFRLKVVGVANPDELFGEGAPIGFEVPKAEKKKDGLPAWIWIVAAVVSVLILAGIGVGWYLASRHAVVSFDASNLAFKDQLVGKPATQTITIKNSGSVDLHVKSVTTGGSDAADFTTTADGCTSKAVAPGKTCTVGIVFTPQGMGARTANLIVTSDAQASPQSLSLKGQGVQPIATLSTGQLVFVGTFKVIDTRTRLFQYTQAPSQSVVVTNTGTAALTISNFQVSGLYAIASQTCTAQALNPLQSCTIAVVSTVPSGTYGASDIKTNNPFPTKLTGALQVVDDAASSPQVVQLQLTSFRG